MTTIPKTSRRKFLKTTGGMAAILATGRMPAIAQGTEVHWLRWNDFVPACDELIRKTIAPAAEKALGIKVKFETVNGNDLQPRITSGIQSGAGPDLIMLYANHPHLYKASLTDLSDVAEEVGKAQGGYYKLASANSSSGGKWLAMPSAIIGAMNVYRKSMFAEAGANEFPKTWDEYRAVGKKMKAKGYPIGQSLGQSFGDPPSFVYPYLWSHGVTEVDDKGKVSINTKECVDAVKYLVGFWKDSMDEGGLAWDDSSNNRAFLAGTICSTLNGASIYIEAKRKPDQYKDEKGKALFEDCLHSTLPAGPKGVFGFHTYTQHVVPSYSKSAKAAKDLLRFIHAKENYDPWFVTGQGFYTPGTAGWEDHPTWKENPIMKPFSLAGKSGLPAGHPGEPGPKAAEVLTKYLLGNMMADAVKGKPVEDVVKSCEAQLKTIYEG
jgi:multiple sugar transport system substrate-binding protein